MESFKAFRSAKNYIKGNFMKKILMALVAAMTMAVAGPSTTEVAEVVIPEQNIYAGVTGVANQLYLDGESDWFTDSIFAQTNGGFGVQGGYVFLRSEAFTAAVEGRYQWIDGDVSTEIASIYVKPAVAFSNFNIYALLGYADVSTDNLFFADGGVVKTDISADGFAWGVGASGKVTENVEIFVDYTVQPVFEGIADLGDIDNDSINIGVNYYFGG
jgi:opacity protein-like surface antigen